MRSIACLLAFAAVAACGASGMRIQAEANPMADLRSYRVYRWISFVGEVPTAQRAQFELFDWRVRTAVDQELARRGYTRSESAPPDFLVGYNIEIREKTTDSFGEYFRYRQEGGTAAPQQAFVFGYEEGTLVIELLDARTRQRLWRGSATAVAQRDQSGERTREAVRKMFEQFPTAG